MEVVWCPKPVFFFFRQVIEELREQVKRLIELQDRSSEGNKMGKPKGHQAETKGSKRRNSKGVSICQKRDCSSKGSSSWLPFAIDQGSISIRHMRSMVKRIIIYRDCTRASAPSKGSNEHKRMVLSSWG